MPRRKYSPEVEGKLAAIAAVHKEHVIARAELRERIEQQFRKELAEYDYRKSRLANEAIHMGAAKSDVKRALSNGNWDNLVKLLALTETETRVEADYAPSDPVWEFEPHKERVRVKWSHWDSGAVTGDETTDAKLADLSGEGYLRVSLFDKGDARGDVRLDLLPNQDKAGDLGYLTRQITGPMHAEIQKRFRDNKWEV